MSITSRHSLRSSKLFVSEIGYRSMLNPGRQW